MTILLFVVIAAWLGFALAEMQYVREARLLSKMMCDATIDLHRLAWSRQIAIQDDPFWKQFL